jgi:SHS2 domain-containing protein
VEARGASLAEAFRYAALGMMSIILDPSAVRPKEARMVNVEASDPGQLLVRWLSELLYLFDGESFAVHETTVLSLEPGRLAAEVRGESFAPNRHPVRLDVKAVTYHQLSIVETKGSAAVRVFFDI